MKKFDTLRNLTQGVKVLAAIMVIMMTAVSGLLAQTVYSHQINAATWSAFGTQTLSGVDWTATGDGGYWGYDATKGQQFGSANNSCSFLNLQTSDIPGTITSVKVNTSGASGTGAYVSVTVGGVDFTYNDPSYSTGDMVYIDQYATDYTFTGSASGAINIDWNQTTSKALYVKSIEVTYIASVGPATLPMTATFDAGDNGVNGWTLDNGTYTNKWYIGQAQGFDNNKLYISCNGGATNKYVATTSNVTASREVMIPANGAILSFDYRVVGSGNHGYMAVRLVNGTNTLDIAPTLNNTPDWAHYSATIAPEYAGQCTLEFQWYNDVTAVNQYPAAVDNVTLVEATCVQPTNLMAVVSNDTAVITWNAPADQTAWTLEYKLANHTDWYAISTTTPTVMLTNLQGNSAYDMRVKANCGTQSSAYTTGNFNIPCLDLTVVEATRTVGTGTSTNYYGGLHPYYCNAWTQTLYTSSVVGATAPGYIKSIAWNCTNAHNTAASALYESEVRIYMGTTTKTTWSSTSDWVPMSDLTLVYDGTGSERIGNTTGWHTFVLDQPFWYDNSKSLVVVVSKASSGRSTTMKFQYTSTSYTCLYRGNGTSASAAAAATSRAYAEHPGTATGTRGSYRTNIRVVMDENQCGDIEACPKPASVTTSNITYNSVNVTWTPNTANQTNDYLLEYKKADATTWTTIPVSGATTYTITGLDQMTAYNVRVKADCGTNNTSEATNASPVSFTTLSMCPVVSGINHSNSANAVTLSWTPGGTEQAWQVQFKLASADDNSWTTIPVYNSPNTTIGGLVGNSSYNVRVKAMCDETDPTNQSAWVTYNFTSGCEALDLPYSTVLGNNTFPQCWTNSKFGTQLSCVQASNNPDAWLMSPAFAVPDNGPVYVRFACASEDSYEILASFRGSAVENFSVLYTGAATADLVDYQSHVIELPDLYKGKNVNFMLRPTAGSILRSNFFEVTQCMGTPKNLTVSSLSSTSIGLSWDAEMGDSWVVEYKTADAADWTTATATQKNYTINGLNVGTEYQIRVKTLCGSNPSEYAELTASTECTALSLPYDEGFENYTMFYEMPHCWSFIDNNPYVTSSVVYPLAYVNTTTAYVHSGTKSLYFRSSNTTPIYAILPEFTENNVTLTFWYRNEGATAANGTLVLGTMTNPADPTTFVEAATLAQLTTMTKVEQSFANMTGKRIAFKYVGGTNNNYYVGIDDIHVEQMAACPKVNSVTVSNVLGNSATVTWVPADPSQTDFVVEYRDVNMPTWNTVSVSNANSTVLPLNENTTYSIRVKAVCSATESSPYVTADDIRTPCLGGKNVSVGSMANNNSSSYLPVYTANAYSMTEQIFTAEELGAAGMINKISIYNSGSTKTRTIDIYLQPTTKTIFSDGYDWEAADTNYRVFSGSYEFEAYQWNEIPFTTPVNYDGTSNYVLIFDDNTGTASSGMYGTYTNTVGVKSLYIYSTSTDYDPTSPATYSGYTYTSRNNIIFYGCSNDCDIPTAVTVDGITSNAAVAHWTPGNASQTDFVVEYKTVEATAWTSLNVTNADSATLTLTGSSNYLVRVKAACSSTSSSLFTDPVPFVTPCDGGVFNTFGTHYSTSNTFPFYTNGKYSWAEMIYHAASVGGAGDISSISWNCTGNNSGNGFFLDNVKIYLAHTTLNETGSTAKDWTPMSDLYLVYDHNNVTIGKELGWEQFIFDTPFHYNGTDNLVVVVSQSTTAASSGVNYDSHQMPNVTGSYYVTHYRNSTSDPMAAECPSPVNPFNSASRNYQTPVVKFEICPGTVSTCSRPINVRVESTTTNSATIAWTPTSSETNWEITYEMNGVPTTAQVTDTLYTITGLTGGKSYTIPVTVKAVCSATESSTENLTYVTFSTQCVTYSVPYFEDFNGYISAPTTYSHNRDASLLPDCWHVEYFGTYTTYYYGPQVIKYSSYSPYNNATDPYLFQVLTSSASYGNHNMTVFPEITGITDRTALFFKGRQSTLNTNIHLNLGYVTDITDTATFVPIHTNIITQTAAKEYEYPLINLPAGARLAFRSECATTSTYYLGIDDIAIKQVLFSKDLALTGISHVADACDLTGKKISITVKNVGLDDTVRTFDASYTINGGTPVTETVTLTTPLMTGESYTYTFNTAPVFTAATNNVSAFVTYAGDENTTNQTIADEVVTNLVSEVNIPYKEDFTNVVVDKNGWVDVSGNNNPVKWTVTSGQARYTFNDDLDADEYLFSTCIHLPAGEIMVSYDYNALSNLAESMNVYIGTSQDPSSLTLLASHTNFSKEDVNMHNELIYNNAVEGTYYIAIKAASLRGNAGILFDNLYVNKLVDLHISAGPNGTISPVGDVKALYGEDFIVSVRPDQMYHTEGVWVNGNQVVAEDMQNSRVVLYTLNNVTTPDTIYATFAISQFTVHKFAVNYNPALYNIPGGHFVPATVDTVMFGAPYTVVMVADPNYHLDNFLTSEMENAEGVTFVGGDDVTADVVEVAPGVYNYVFDAIFASKYVQATFRKDTVNIHYNVLTGKGSVDNSGMLTAPAQYDTWIDYDANHTSTITPANGYYVVDVNGNGPVNTLTFNNVTATQNVNVKFGFQVTADVTNYDPTYLGSTAPRGTLTPATALVAEGDALTLNGTIEDHFHLNSFLVDGVENIQNVNFTSDSTYTYTFASVNGNYHVNAIIQIDTFCIRYNVNGGLAVVNNEATTTDPATTITCHNYGDDWLASFAPVAGYDITNIFVDGVEYGFHDNYQFSFISGTHVVDITVAPKMFSIVTNGYGDGTVTPGISSFAYDPSMTYTFTATPSAGNHISSLLHNNVIVNVANPEATYTETLTNITENHTYVVYFEPNEYTITATANAGGIITPSGVHTYTYGATPVYTITPNAGYHISDVKVNGTSVGAVTTYTFPAITANKTIEAIFVADSYTVTVATLTHGTINGPAGPFAYGATPTYTITPDAGYLITDVTVDGQSVGAVSTYTFAPITGNHTISATFAQLTYTINAIAGNGGSITPAGATVVNYGANQSYTIAAATGYHIDNVFVDGVSVGAVTSYTFSNVTADHTISATFAANTFTVTVNQPQHGTIAPGTQTVVYGATPTFTITPNVGYTVGAITLNGTNVMSNAVQVGNAYSYTLPAVTANATLTATMNAITYTIVASAGANGSITPSGSATVNYGANATYSITPNAGYEIDKVMVDGINMGAVGTYTFVNVVENHTINATFKQSVCDVPSNLYTINIDTTSATFTWYHAGAQSYDVRYKAQGSTTFVEATATTNLYNATGLTPNTTYSWQVRAHCAANLVSEWSNAMVFRTKATPEIDHTGIENRVSDLARVYASQNNVYITNDNGVRIDNVAIYDVYGKLIYTGKVNSNTEVISLNVATGTYMVRLSTENGMANYKVFITK